MPNIEQMAIDLTAARADAEKLNDENVSIKTFIVKVLDLLREHGYGDCPTDGDYNNLYEGLGNALLALAAARADVERWRGVAEMLAGYLRDAGVCPPIEQYCEPDIGCKDCWLKSTQGFYDRHCAEGRGEESR